MKKLMTGLYFAIFATLLLFTFLSCNKGSENQQFSEYPLNNNLSDREKLSMKIFGNTEFKFNKNDSTYLNNIKRLSKSFNLFGNGALSSSNRVNSCNLNGGDSTYGWYSDPEHIIIEGPFKSAKNVTYETVAENCPGLLAIAAEANQYLINEGYADITDIYYGKIKPALRYHAIHAANALVELKTEFINNYARNAGSSSQEKLFNCILQAIGYSAFVELGANWAIMSKQQIIRAVGRLASKHLSWFGAGVAIISFIDCMWG